jgi:hypothetical protein
MHFESAPPFATAQPLSEFWLYRLRRLGRRDDLVRLEVHEVPPPTHSGRYELRVVGLHHLVALLEVGRRPTCDLAQAVGSEATLFTEAPVDRHNVDFAEMFDDHVEHGGISRLETNRGHHSSNEPPSTKILRDSIPTTDVGDEVEKVS